MGFFSYYWKTRFKPYYNWNTFNTETVLEMVKGIYRVLNLIITGIPSIQRKAIAKLYWILSFKPYYNWNTFNTHNES